MSPNDELPPSLSATQSDSSSLSVLIVDDALAILELLRDVLEDEGFKVLLASNGQAALDILQQTTVALVVTDVMMPVISGIELIDHLQRHLRTAAIPVLCMSAAMPQYDGAGVAGIIEKPFSLDDFIARVHQLVSGQRPSSASA